MRQIQKGRYEVNPSSVQIMVDADGSLHGVIVYIPEAELKAITEKVISKTTPEEGVRLICWHPNRTTFHIDK